MTLPPNELSEMIPPSPWVTQFASLIPAGEVLDLACGSGRHTRLLAGLGHPVLATDRNEQALAGLQGIAGVRTLLCDLEGDHWPLSGRFFAGIVVTNYLWRPRLADLLALLSPGGVLIYETFMQGNAAYGKPSNPEFLLGPGELRQLCTRAGLREIAFSEGLTETPKPAMRQAICACRD
jgi:SAM-dependent methyltransferase